MINKRLLNLYFTKIIKNISVIFIIKMIIALIPQD